MAAVRARVESALAPFSAAGRVIVAERAEDVIAAVSAWVAPVVMTAEPEPWLRARLVEKAGVAWLMLFNEGESEITPAVGWPDEAAGWREIDPTTGDETGLAPCEVRLDSGGLRLFRRS